MSVCFVDTETTGLDPQRHEVWDVAIIDEDGYEREFHIRPMDYHPDSMEPDAARISRFYSRTGASGWFWDTRSSVAREIAQLTEGRHLVGAVPSFDAMFLTKLLHREGLVPAWHYHLIDVETLIAGRLGLQPPQTSDDLSRAIGVNPDDFERHTALGDARWVRAQYEAVFAHAATRLGRSGQ